ncbi:hypothetical protein F511_25283 [Dorcoceras hygrometricum]|uniref:Uncharacterized protein n=1 Tax=Dorcoceras hygrometricum TaxID=472368 RepID=A0A2Z7AI91_9LAMI|nr:hypothetical protein F511_25283 [Dorcoceras hygrometricum]
MSLFDLRDVCMVIGSLATLDLPMIVDLIGIFVLKEPYCTLTMTNWFLQALSVIPRGSWGDVARRFTMIRWSNAIIGVVTTGFECLPPSCDGLTGSEDHGPMFSPVDTPCGIFRYQGGQSGGSAG